MRIFITDLQKKNQWSLLIVILSKLKKVDSYANKCYEDEWQESVAYFVVQKSPPGTKVCVKILST